MYTGQNRESMGQDTKTFVGGLPQYIDEQELAKFMSQFGSVSDYFMPRDQLNGTHKGYAFFTFSGPCSDKLFGEHMFKNKTIDVKRNFHNSIFLTQLPQSISSLTVKNALESKGFPVEEILIGNQANGVPTGVVAIRLAKEEYLQKASTLESLDLGQAIVPIHIRLPNKQRSKRSDNHLQPNSPQSAHNTRGRKHPSQRNQQQPAAAFKNKLAEELSSDEAKPRKLSITLQNNSKEFHLSSTTSIITDIVGDGGSPSLAASSRGDLGKLQLEEQLTSKKLSGGSSSFYTRPETFSALPALMAMPQLVTFPSTVGMRVSYYTFPGKD